MSFLDVDEVISITIPLSFDAVTGSAPALTYNLSQNGYNLGSLRPDYAVIRSITFGATFQSNTGAAGISIAGGLPLFISSSLNNKQGFIGMISPYWNPAPTSATTITCNAQSNPNSLIKIAGKDINIIEFQVYESFVNSPPTAASDIAGVLALTIDFVRTKKSRQH